MILYDDQAKRERIREAFERVKKYPDSREKFIQLLAYQEAYKFYKGGLYLR